MDSDDIGIEMSARRRCVRDRRGRTPCVNGPEAVVIVLLRALGESVKRGAAPGRAILNPLELVVEFAEVLEAVKSAELVDERVEEAVEAVEVVEG